MPTKQECPYNRSQFLKECFGAEPSISYDKVVQAWKHSSREKKWCPSRDLYQKVKADLAKKAAKPNITIVKGKPPSTTSKNDKWVVTCHVGNEAKEKLEQHIDALADKAETVQLKATETMLDNIYHTLNGKFGDVREAVLAARRVVGKHLVPKE